MTIKMAMELYFCEICRFAYKDRETAEKCEDWCRKHKSCSLEITKSAVGEIKNEK
ncbi:hypothetical protein HYU09_00020 [Candidatus Woesearchaeota archaeon]|nr:hypothetical protein [Candidatus Woesearchaeota archaeon]